MYWRHEIGLRLGTALAPVKVSDYLAAKTDTVHFIMGKVITKTGYLSMHIGTAQTFGVGVFAGRHFYQWRSAERDHRLVLNHNVVVAHTWLVSPARGGRAEYDRNRWDTHLGQFGDLIKQSAGFSKMA